MLLSKRWSLQLWQPTFVFLQWCACEAASCPRHKALNEDIDFGLHVNAPLKKHFVVASWVSPVIVGRSFNVLPVVISLSACCKLFRILRMFFYFPDLSQMSKRVLEEHHISLMDIWAKTDIMYSDIIICLFQIIN